MRHVPAFAAEEARTLVLLFAGFPAIARRVIRATAVDAAHRVGPGRAGESSRSSVWYRRRSSPSRCCSSWRTAERRRSSSKAPEAGLNGQNLRSRGVRANGVERFHILLGRNLLGEPVRRLLEVVDEVVSGGSPARTAFARLVVHLPLPL